MASQGVAATGEGCSPTVTPTHPHSRPPGRGAAQRDRAANPGAPPGPGARRGHAQEPPGRQERKAGHHQEFVLRTLEERDIRFVRLWFTDVLGFLKSVAVAPAELEGPSPRASASTGSAIEGFARVYESDMLAKPDPSTFQVLPWRGETPGTAADVLRHPACRTGPVLRRPAARAQARAVKASDLGFTFYTHPEIEFFLLKSRGRTTGAARGSTTSGYFDHTPHGIGNDFRRRRSRCWSRWASPSSSATTRARPGSRRSTCATPTRSRPPTTS